MATKRMKIEEPKVGDVVFGGPDAAPGTGEEAAGFVRTAGTKRTRVKPKFEDVNDTPPATPDKEDLSKPFAASGSVERKMTAKTANTQTMPKASMPAGLDVEKAMVDAREAAPPKPKRARKPKTTVSDTAVTVSDPDTGAVMYETTKFTLEKDPRDMSVEELAEELKGFAPNEALVVPADAKVEYIAPVEGGTSEEPTKPVFKVLPGYEIVKAPFHTNAPYTVVVRHQTGQLLFEVNSYERALDEAKDYHVATARRISVLRPGMKAVHYHNVKDFYEMRSQELRNSMAAGQARADRERDAAPGGGAGPQDGVRGGGRTYDDHQHDQFAA